MIRAEAHPRQQHDARIAGQTEQQLRRLGVFEQPVDELAAIRALAELLHVDDRVLRRARVREQITLSGSPPGCPMRVAPSRNTPRRRSRSTVCVDEDGEHHRPHGIVNADPLLR
jgi:hypothetical protein